MLQYGLTMLLVLQLPWLPLLPPVGETLHFKLSPEIVAEDVLLYSDYPAPDKQYRRDEYQELTWVYRGEEPCWDPDRFVDLPIERAGTFKFYFCKREAPARR